MRIVEPLHLVERSRGRESAAGGKRILRWHGWRGRVVVGALRLFAICWPMSGQEPSMFCAIWLTAAQLS